MDHLIAELHLSVPERIERAISLLPALIKAEIPQDDSCPICLNPFDTIFEGSSLTEITEEPTPAPGEIAGVTKLVGCGHIFCKPW